MPSERGALVVDASCFVEVLLGSPRGRRVGAHLTGHHLHAPDLFDSEVLNALKGLERRSAQPTGAVSTAVRDLVRAPVRRWSGRDLAEVAWVLRHRFSAYDAMYVALASVLGCPVLTVDHKWQRAGDVGVAVLTVS